MIFFVILLKALCPFVFVFTFAMVLLSAAPCLSTVTKRYNVAFLGVFGAFNKVHD